MTSTPPIVITATPLADEGLSVKHDIKIGDWVGAGWQVIELADTHLTARHRLDDLATATRPAIELFEFASVNWPPAQLRAHSIYGWR